MHLSCSNGAFGQKAPGCASTASKGTEPNNKSLTQSSASVDWSAMQRTRATVPSDSNLTRSIKPDDAHEDASRETRTPTRTLFTHRRDDEGISTHEHLTREVVRNNFIPRSGGARRAGAMTAMIVARVPC